MSLNGFIDCFKCRRSTGTCPKPSDASESSRETTSNPLAIETWIFFSEFISPRVLPFSLLSFFSKLIEGEEGLRRGTLDILLQYS
jgi:hypothetical protein